MGINNALGVIQDLTKKIDRMNYQLIAIDYSEQFVNPSGICMPWGLPCSGVLGDNTYEYPIKSPPKAIETEAERLLREMLEKYPDADAS